MTQTTLDLAPIRWVAAEHMPGGAPNENVPPEPIADDLATPATVIGEDEAVLAIIRWPQTDVAGPLVLPALAAVVERRAEQPSTGHAAAERGLGTLVPIADPSPLEPPPAPTREPPRIEPPRIEPAAVPTVEWARTELLLASVGAPAGLGSPLVPGAGHARLEPAILAMADAVGPPRAAGAVTNGLPPEPARTPVGRRVGRVVILTMLLLVAFAVFGRVAGACTGGGEQDSAIGARPGAGPPPGLVPGEPSDEQDDREPAAPSPAGPPAHDPRRDEVNVDPPAGSERDHAVTTDANLVAQDAGDGSTPSTADDSTLTGDPPVVDPGTDRGDADPTDGGTTSGDPTVTTEGTDPADPSTGATTDGTGGLGVTDASATPPATSEPGTVDPAAAGTTGRPFSADSSWNVPLPSTTQWETVSGLNEGYWYISYDAYSIPVVHASPSDPLVTVDVPGSWGWPPTTLELHIPSDVTGAAGTDGALTVVDGSTVVDFWIFRRDGTNHATAEAWAQTDTTTGTGWGSTQPWQAAGISAAGSSELAGLITGDDLAAGSIQHALQVALPCSLQGAGPTGDAIASDGCGAGSIQEGQRLGIPAGTPKPSGLSTLGSMMWDALVQYGAYNVNTAGCCASVNFGADPRSVPAAMVNDAMADLDAIRPYLRVVA